MAATKILLTTGVAYLRSLLQTFGSAGSSAGKPGMMIFCSDNIVATDDGTLKTLISFTLPAGTMENDGDVLMIEGAVTLLNDADLKLSAVTFGGTVVDGRSGIADAGLSRVHRCTIIRKSATTQVANGFCAVSGSGTVTVTTPAETLSGAITIALKGQNSTDATAGSVTSRSLTVWYFPIGQAANFS
jgi:hypothetical protein